MIGLAAALFKWEAKKVRLPQRAEY